MSDIRIRRCDTEDDDTVDTLLELQHETFGSVYHNPIRIAESLWWIAWNGTEPAGYCGMTLYPHLSSVFLCLSGVLSGYRGQGLQRRLIRVRERAAVKLGYPRSVSYTTVDNAWSANNLIRCGYRLYVPKTEWGVDGAAYFQKQIGSH
jgi:GNAT superfamily N-acetyltransferase